MSATAPALPSPGFNPRPLWATVGVLGVAVVALGATLVHIQTRPADGHVALAAAPAALSAAAPATQVPAAESLQAREALVPPAPAAKPAPVRPVARPVAAATPAGPATASPAPVAAPVPASPPAPVLASPGPANPAPTVVTEQGPVASQPLPQPTRVLCSTCGTVESVTPFERKAATNGVGAVAGGALGAVVGNQVGKGGGRTAATILGAIGGGVAGHMIEKNVRRETAYRVQVRMEDGSLRTFDQARAPAIGSKVTVDGSVLRAADGSGFSAPPPAAAPAPMTAPRPQADQRA